MNIIIHGKQTFLGEEKPDINIELPNPTDKVITKITFRLPHISGYPKEYSFEKIDYSLEAKVWIEFDDVDKIFNDFQLATNFKIYRQKWNTTYIDKVNNRWDDESKTMYVDC